MKKLRAGLEKTLLPLARTVAETCQRVAEFVTEGVGALLNKKIFGDDTGGSLLGAVIGGGLVYYFVPKIFSDKDNVWFGRWSKS